MAEITLGIGTSHTPLLTFDAALWESYSRRDYASTRLNLSDGRFLDYAQLLAETGGRFAPEATAERFRARAAACQAALDRIAAQLAAARPDAVIVVTDDQSELFRLANMPAISIYYGEEIVTMPRAGVAHLAFERETDYFRPMTEAYAMDRPHRFPGLPGFARELIERLIDRHIDMGAAAGVEDPARAGLGHGIGFVIRRLFGVREIPVIPLLLNTYHPPNAPGAARCFDIGRALREAIEESPQRLRLALVASGGLSHFVVDEALDRRVLAAMTGGPSADLRGLAREAMQGGSSEIRNWILVAGAIEHLSNRWFAYEPLYRTPAGTGIGVAFGVWEPAPA